jgi:threonine/homoserine/homoserine lactone efflux protein
MSIETWLGYVLACFIVVLIPGPNVMFTVSYAIRDGARSGIGSIPGVLFGALIAMSLSLAGAGSVLAASAFWFSVLKVLGAIYLAWLAYSLWTSPADTVRIDRAAETKPLARLFWQGTLISILNPKGPPFYIAFIPQFVASGAPLIPQFAILIGTFLAVALINCVLWVYAASAMRQHFRRPGTLRLFNRLGAGCLMAASAVTLKETRAI